MIKVNFNKYASYVADSLTQWDVNQVLRVEGLNLSVAPEVHFTNAILGKSLVRQAELNKGVVSVKIPNSLLQNDLDILAYVGLYDGSTFKVIETVRIPVIKKEKPEDYKIENDEEIYSFNELENKIVNAKKNIADQCDDNLVEMKASIAKETKTLSAQVANIIAHNNDTDGNTELLDIRTGADGTVYGSSGDAVRSQVSGIKGDLDDLEGNSYKKSLTTLTRIKSVESVSGTITCSNMGDLVTYTTGDSSGSIIIRFKEPITISPSDHAYFIFNDRKPFGSVATLRYLGKNDEYIKTDYITAPSVFWGMVVNEETTIYGLKFTCPIPNYSVTANLFIGLGTSTKPPMYEPKYIFNLLTKDDEVLTKDDENGILEKSIITTKWKGKKLLSYGDSQTGQNKWQPFVANTLGMTSVVFGFGGYPITQVNPSNIGWSLSSEYMLGQLKTKIQTENPDIVTIMGLTNDFNYDGTVEGMNNITIGKNESTDLKTVKGALKTIVKFLQTEFPTLTIVLMSPCGGYTKQTGSNLNKPLVNANGNTFGDYAIAVKEIAEWCGVPFIDVYSCGITIYNSASYIEDGTHMNSTTGAKKVADAVINGLKNIQPYN